MTEQEKIEFKKRLDLLAEDKLDEMRKLLDSGVDVNEKDEAGQTLLHFISSMGLLNSAKFLLENGADENIKDNADKTPLDYAQNEEMKALFHTSKTSSKSEINPLHEAVKKGDVEKVKSLLDSGMDANTQDEDGVAPLHEANENRDKEIVDLLLEAGANIDIEDNDGYTPLHYACANGAKEIVALLLEAGANVNAKNKNGRSPLYFVNDKEIAQLLLDKGADFRSKDKDGNTPLVFAHVSGVKEVIDLLTEKEIQKRAQGEISSQEDPLNPPVQDPETQDVPTQDPETKDIPTQDPETQDIPAQDPETQNIPAQGKEAPLPVSSQDIPAVIKEGKKESSSTEPEEEPEEGSGKGYGKNDTSVWTYLQRKKAEDSEKGKHIPVIEHIEYLEKKKVKLLHISFASGASVDDFGKDMTYYPSVSDTLDEYIAMASAVRLRGDKSVSLEGSPEFKRKMYLACQIVGLKTPDYTPYNEAERATAKGQHDAKEFQNYRFHVFGEPTAEQIKALQDKLKQEQMDKEATQKKEEEGEKPEGEPEVEPEAKPEAKPEIEPEIEPVSGKESSQTLQDSPQEETKKPLNEQLQEKEQSSNSSENSQKEEDPEEKPEVETEAKSEVEPEVEPETESEKDSETENQAETQEEQNNSEAVLENSSEPEDMFAPIKRQKETWGNDYRPLKKEIDAKLRKKATEDLLNLPLYYRKNDLNLMFSKDVNGYNQYIKQYGDEDPNHYYEPGSAYRSIIETALAKYEDEYLKEEIEAEACKKGATLITLNGKKYVLSLLSSKMDKPFVDSIKAAYNAIWRFRYIQKVSQEKTQLHQKAFEKYAAEFDPEKMHQFDKYFFLTNTKNKKNTSYRQFIAFAHEDKNGKLKLDKVDLVFMKSCLEKVANTSYGKFTISEEEKKTYLENIDEKFSSALNEKELEVKSLQNLSELSKTVFNSERGQILTVEECESDKLYKKEIEKAIEKIELDKGNSGVPVDLSNYSIQDILKNLDKTTAARMSSHYNAIYRYYQLPAKEKKILNMAVNIYQDHYEARKSLKYSEHLTQLANGPNFSSKYTGTIAFEENGHVLLTKVDINFMRICLEKSERLLLEKEKEKVSEKESSIIKNQLETLLKQKEITPDEFLKAREVYQEKYKALSLEERESLKAKDPEKTLCFVNEDGQKTSEKFHAGLLTEYFKEKENINHLLKNKERSGKDGI